ncbi:hypothetical protein [Bradyrhizobium sp.]|uniref:hypothetical protein n=1 Tax=Bradyrhizobium sp. TaxID=376 RepID=UPI003BAF7B7A
MFAGFSRKLRAAFDANGERRVSGKKPGMVSKWWMRQTRAAFLAQPGHQSRLFGGSNQSDFWRNFEELSPMQ